MNANSEIDSEIQKSILYLTVGHAVMREIQNQLQNRKSDGSCILTVTYLAISDNLFTAYAWALTQLKIIYCPQPTGRMGHNP